MRHISILIILTVSLSSQGQTENPFLSLRFDKVVLYDYQPKGENPSLVDNEGKLVTTVKIHQQIELDRTTIQQLNRKLGDRKSYGQSTAFCFDPHLGIVYYQNEKIIRNVLVCMACNILRADIEIPAQLQGRQGQEDNVYYVGMGMSKSFRQYINGLLKKYKFSHQIQEGSVFDE